MGEDYFENYHTFDENLSWLRTLSKTYSNMTELLKLGKTFEGRDLIAIRIFSPKKNGGQKKSIWIDGGIHAREWISPATVNYIIWRLLVDYEGDSDVRKMLDSVDFYILPQMNPDGYAYSWEKDLMWRKNRVPHPGSHLLEPISTETGTMPGTPETRAIDIAQIPLKDQNRSPRMKPEVFQISLPRLNGA